MQGHGIRHVMDDGAYGPPPPSYSAPPPPPYSSSFTPGFSYSRPAGQVQGPSQPQGPTNGYLQGPSSQPQGPTNGYLPSANQRGPKRQQVGQYFHAMSPKYI